MHNRIENQNGQCFSSPRSTPRFAPDTHSLLSGQMKDIWH